MPIKRHGVTVYKVKDVSGFDCSGCGTHHQLGAYVAAHAKELLVHTCKCGAKHETKDFKVWRI